MSDMGWSRPIADEDEAHERACDEHRHKCGVDYDPEEEGIDCIDMPCLDGCPFR